MANVTPTIKEMVSRLVSTPSVSSTQSEFDQSNSDVIHLLANWLDPIGFDVTIAPVAGSAGKHNLIARIGGGEDGLVLSGHSDTVPFDQHLWESDPFKVHEAEERWYGLGSCDMKSFFAIAIEAARPYLNSKLQAPLIIMATADEESSMCGAKQLTRNDVNGAGFAIIGEPTDLRPIVKHKGIMMMNLRIEGTSGHSSDPSLGSNAIEGMQSALAELMSIRAAMQETHQDSHFDVSFPTMNFGCVHGGDNPNRICDHVDLAFDLRNLPSMDMAGFTDDVQDQLMARLAPEGFTCSLEMLHSPVPAFDNSGSEFAEEIANYAGNPSGTVAFGTEAPYLKNLALDTVVIGPGSINQAHQPNEYLPLEQIEPAVQLIRRAIETHCKPDS